MAKSTLELIAELAGYLEAAEQAVAGARETLGELQYNLAFPDAPALVQPVASLRDVIQAVYLMSGPCDGTG